MKYFGYFSANTLQHFHLCKLRAKQSCRDILTNCPTRKRQRHFAAGDTIGRCLFPHEDFPPVDDVASWRQIVKTFVHRSAQKIVDDWGSIFVGGDATDGCIVAAQCL